jgi:hypothetical protein
MHTDTNAARNADTHGYWNSNRYTDCNTKCNSDGYAYTTIWHANTASNSNAYETYTSSARSPNASASPNAAVKRE